MTSGLFTVDFSDFAIAIPRGIDASGRHIAGECVLGVSVAGPDFAGEKLAYACFEEEPGRRSAAKLLTRVSSRIFSPSLREPSSSDKPIAVPNRR
jgi:hypothetical protein